MRLSPRPQIHCQACGERLRDSDLDLVAWRFAMPGRCLSSAAVVHRACRSSDLYPYQATLKDFIALQPLFRAYFNVAMREGEMAEGPLWEVVRRVFCTLKRDAYFAFTESDDHQYRAFATGG